MKDDQGLLLHIRDSITRIQEYTNEGREQFLDDLKTQDAVIRQLEIIGEASKHLSTAVKKRAPQLPWKEIAGMRDIMIHKYFGVDLNLVWDVVENQLSALLSAINDELKSATR
jgi:uncharacterized protein with HEPN domain